MPKLFLLFVFLALAQAQTNIYLRTSPGGNVVTSAVFNGTTYQITTESPHGHTVGQTVIIWGVCTNAMSSTLNASTVNGFRKVASVVDATDYTITTTSGANIPNSGSMPDGTASCGSGNQANEGLLTAYTLGAGPTGILDGPTGPLFRQLALSTPNSNVAQGLANTGSCPGDGVCVIGGVITITTTYPHGVLVSGDNGQEYFSITGTTSAALNTNGTYQSSSLPGVQFANYAVTSATTYTFTAAAPAGVANGDYTSNLACGSNGSTYDTINGTQNCVVISQIAYVAKLGVATATYQSGIGATGTAGQTCNIRISNYNGGADATGTVALTGTNTIAAGTPITITSPGYGYQGEALYGSTTNGTASCGGNNTITSTIDQTGDNPYWDGVYSYNGSSLSPINYRHIYDGGSNAGSSNIWASFLQVGIQFLVDQGNQNFLNALTYSINYVERGAGVNFSVNELSQFDGFAESNWSMGWSFLTAWGFLSPSEQTTALNKILNDISDPVDFPQCSIANTSVGNNQLPISSGASGTFAGGTSGTSFQLASGFPTFSLVNNVISATVSGNPSYGVVATYTTSTGAGTVTSWSNGSPSSGNTYVIYQSGIESSTAQTSQLTAGTATAGSTTSVTLNTTSSTGNYLNEEIFFPLLNERGFITAYNTSTGVATFTPAVSTAPSSGTFYAISQTALVTGYNTTFSSVFNVGDAIVLNSGGMNGLTLAQVQAYVAYVASNTSMYVLNGNQLNQYDSTTVPTTVWHFKAWQPGDCGYLWASHHSIQDQTGNPTTYPVQGGGGATWSANASGSFMAGPKMSADFILAQYDARAVWDLAVSEAYWFDFFFAPYMAYNAGSTHAGPDYMQVVSGGMIYPVDLIMQGLTGASPAAPNFDATGPWAQSSDIFRMFSVLPDWNSTVYSQPCMTPVQFGSSPGLFCPASVGQVNWGSASAFIFQPHGMLAKVYKNFLQNASTYQGWKWGSRPMSTYVNYLALVDSPNIGSVDFTTQPKQYCFCVTDWQNAANLSGWNYGSKWAGLLAISKTTWTSTATPAAAKQGSHLMVQFRTYAGDYDCNMIGHVQLWKVGALLGSDILTTNSDNCAFGDNSDYTVVGDQLQFGGTRTGYVLDQPPGTYPYGVATVPPNTSLMTVTEWSSANAGSFGTLYGDQNSQYMRICGDERGGYNQVSSRPPYVGFNYDLHCVSDLKPTGGDQFIVDARFVSTTTTQEILTRIHYPQNGQAQTYNVIPYPEGHTTCPGSHGCTGLNTDRWIQELESGTPDGETGDPTPTFGLISNFLSPSSLYITWDCPGGVECSPSSTYSGGSGNTDRITICAGSGSCSSSANLLESFVVHKVVQSLTDTSLNTSAITTSDGNWFGAEMYGANSCAVVMEARGGVTHAAMSSFTPPSSSGVCANNVQYLFGGFTPGSYSVTVGGNTVFGSPFTVSAGDNSIEFTSLGGTVSLYGGGGNASSSISGQITIGGNVIVH
jgi:hypothetical protein